MKPRFRLDATQAGFDEAFAAMQMLRRRSAEGPRAQTLAILDAVRARGWEAVREASLRLDGFEPARVDADEIEAAWRATPEPLRAAMETARARLAAWCEAQKPAPARHESAGVALEMTWEPLARVGVYAPGGRAAYPSSVIMNVVPARVAGVRAVALATPSREATTLAAARCAGVAEIWRVGGAQAIAALAYGAGPVEAVDMVAGPGSAWVAEAKRAAYGEVGVDMPAGPSEILIVADKHADPDWAALDLLAQAEHDPLAQATAISDDAAWLDAVAARVAARAPAMARAEIASASWRDYGALVLARSLDHAAALSNAVAPEHVQVMTRDAETLAARLTTAGAVFVGAFASEALADYTAGSCHVLPTMGAARFASGLGPHDFLRRRVAMRASAEAARELGAPAMTLARAEGLEGHAAALAARMEAQA